MFKLISTAIIAIALTGSAHAAPRNNTTMKACAAEWKTAKADETVKQAGWPKYWSACAKRAKAEKAAGAVAAAQ